ncbi:MAG: peptide deformylase [Spirulinaceae cyanobacterium]
MAELPKIAQLGNPLLRRIANQVEDPQREEIHNLIDDLIAKAALTNGVGIAAPQICQPYRLFIVASHPNPRYPQAPEMEPTAMINPKVLSHSTEMVKDWEGCLSIPGIRGLVPRYQAIEVEYTNQEGILQRLELEGFVARIFQHELDHLNGILFVDRLESTQDMFTEQEYGKIANC